VKILVLNAGSSSQKSCLYDLSAPLPLLPPEMIWEAHVDWTHTPGTAEIKVKTASGKAIHETLSNSDRPTILRKILETLWQGETAVVADPGEIAGVGHRVVHGGSSYQQSVLITPAVKSAITELAVFAPEHNPANLEGIEAIEQVFGNVTQVATFDTAFHAQMPKTSAVYPGPYAWFEKGLRRYGFHGISHQYVSERTSTILQRDLDTLKLVTCHLGNGCSLAAIRNGRSIDTTMGFTPLEGLMMGSRSGSLDPGLVLHLIQHEGYSAEELTKVLNKESGLKGISGISADLRPVISAMEQGNEQAKLAIDLYIHSLIRGIGSMVAVLGGLDALVFTAGVGENAPSIRAAVCEGLQFLGIQLDHGLNNRFPVDLDIATPESSVRVVVVHTQEDWAIAKDCWKLIQ
jgi:acetate kinase